MEKENSVKAKEAFIPQPSMHSSTQGTGQVKIG